ncbi:uncharacterized protein LOC124158142 [Ischnura elegans]|uniref:uncharacterized protein LOC124158142 n=1 Tax=Ischnura elegans TaxID=197161 RepID=UPI001ED8923E|nr:uncharacterized protein LOC124158142 [Ischnura elegans]
MSYGLRNAVHTVQRFIDDVVRYLDFTYTYLDDILIASKDEDEHEGHLSGLFLRLSDYGVVINPFKCVFGVSQVTLLGYCISADGTKPLKDNVNAIQEFPELVTIKQLHQFLDIHHIVGADNVAAHALSQIEEVTRAIDFETLGRSQETDEWTEAIPVEDISAKTVVRAFLWDWLSRFGMPQQITTDQGRRFKWALFHQLSNIARAVHLRTSAYHLAANGMEDIQDTPAELVYGEPQRTPGEFLSPTSGPTPNATYFTSQLLEHFQGLSPRLAARHGTRHIFIFKDLPSTSYVFVRHDASHTALQAPYNGPYKVLQQDGKTNKVRLPNCDANIAIDRLKPAYIISEEPIIPEERSKILIPTTRRQPSAQVLPSTSIPPADSTTITPEAQGEDHALPSGRPTRRVRFPLNLLDYQL